MFIATLFVIIKKLETTKMSFNWKMKNQMGLSIEWNSFSDKKERNTDTFNNTVSLKYVVLRKRSQTQKATCYMIPFP